MGTSKKVGGLMKNKGKGELDEQLREYINEWRKQRGKEEEELKRLKEKQAKRKEIRAEQEKKLAQQKKEEEERLRKEEAEKKAKEAEEKKKRLEEAENDNTKYHLRNQKNQSQGSKFKERKKHTIFSYFPPCMVNVLFFFFEDIYTHETKLLVLFRYFVTIV